MMEGNTTRYTMKSRTKALSDIRPRLDLEEKSSLELEKFQNQVFRPILKFQHDLLVIHFRALLQQSKRRYYDQTSEKKRNIIQDLLKMPGQRMFSLALIIGLLTTDEYEVYSGHSREFSKRIVSMLILRVVDGLEEFKNEYE